MSNYRRKALSEYEHACSVCGEVDDLEVHHRDGDRTNNALENLLVLCHSCHVKLHGEGLNGLEDDLLPVSERKHIDKSATRFQLETDRKKWEDWKATVPRSKSLEQRIIELIKADTEGRVEGESDE